MSLGENLQFLRKQKNMTQEQLAETLEVSRQSVSKWESDSTYPETDKLIQLANLFHCSLDDLMRKDVVSQYVEDKDHYDQFKNQISKRITLGVGLILMGMTLSLFLNAVFSNRAGLDMEALSGIIFFLFLVVAVALFVVTGLQSGYYEKKHPYIENFYTDDEKEAFHKKFTLFITSGVVLIISGLILMLGMEFVVASDHIIRSTIDFESLEACLFLLFVTIASVLFVYAGTQESKYNIAHYNLIHDHNSQTYKNDKKVGLICGCIMMTATIIFLTCGFIWNLWKFAWVVYPIFGIACGIVATVINRSNEEEEI